jgi:hypothetical protein
LLRPSISALTALLIPGLLLACGSDSSTAAEEPQATAIVVTAADFLNGAQCLGATGSLHAWGVHLEHVAHAPALPGTPPPAVEAPLESYSAGFVECVQGIAFGNVEVGGKYRATICGYEDPAVVTDVLLTENQLDDVCTYKGVAAQWKYECAETEVEYQALRHVHDCKLVGDSPVGAETRVTVVPDPASCVSMGGEIERFHVFRDGEALSDEPIPCLDEFSVGAVQGGDSFDLNLLAYRAGEEEPALGTVCHARAVTGATVPATCDPLQSEGGIEVQLEAAFTALGAACDEGWSDLLLTLDTGETLEVPDPTCSGSVRFSGVSPGARELTLAVTRGTESSSVTCSAAVEPGLVAAPACAAE